MDLRKRLSAEDSTEPSGMSRHPWWRWVLLTTLLLLLASPYFLDFRIIETVCYRGRYRPAEAVTGKGLPDKAAFISINRNGVVRVSTGEDMSLPTTSTEELHVFVESVVSTYPERPFVLKIDKDIPYESVDDVLAALKDAGVHQVFFHSVLPDPPNVP